VPFRRVVATTIGSNSESTSETLQFPKLNDKNYYAWADNMKATLQAQKLWLLVDSLEECSPIPTSKPPFFSEGLTYLTSSVEYRDWLKSREDYLDWLQSDSAAIERCYQIWTAQTYCKYFNFKGNMGSSP